MHALSYLEKDPHIPDIPNRIFDRGPRRPLGNSLDDQIPKKKEHLTVMSWRKGPGSYMDQMELPQDQNPRKRIPLSGQLHLDMDPLWEQDRACFSAPHADSHPGGYFWFNFSPEQGPLTQASPLLFSCQVSDVVEGTEDNSWDVIPLILPYSEKRGQSTRILSTHFGDFLTQHTSPLATRSIYTSGIDLASVHTA